MNKEKRVEMASQDPGYYWTTTTTGNTGNHRWTAQRPTQQPLVSAYSKGTSVSTPNFSGFNMVHTPPSLQEVVTAMQAQIDMLVEVVDQLRTDAESLIIELRYHKKRAEILEQMR